MYRQYCHGGENAADRNLFHTVQPYHRNIPFIGHKRLVIIQPSSHGYRVKQSALLGEIDRIYHKIRPSLAYQPTEDYLNSRPMLYFDDETRSIRAKTAEILKRIHTPVPRAQRPLPLPGDLYYSHTELPITERITSNNYIDRLLASPVAVSVHADPPQYSRLGKGHLACITYAGGRPISRRRNLASAENYIRNDINVLSHYNRFREAAEKASEAEFHHPPPSKSPVTGSWKSNAPRRTQSDKVFSKPSESDVGQEKKKKSRLETLEAEALKEAQEEKRRKEELKRQEELADQAAAERQAELERKAQKEEEERIQREENERLEAIKRAKEEEERKAREEEEARLAKEEEERLAKEAEEKRKAKEEEERRAEEERKAREEEERKKKEEEERLAKEEEERRAREEEERRAEEERLAKEEEERRLREEEEQRLKEEEEQRKKEEEEQRLKEEAKAGEEEGEEAGEEEETAPAPATTGAAEESEAEPLIEEPTSPEEAPAKVFTEDEKQEEEEEEEEEEE